MKKSIRYLISYMLGLLAVTVILFALRQVFFVLLLLLMLMLPVGTVFCMLRAFKTLVISCQCNNETVEEGNPIAVSVTVRCKSFLPALACKLSFCASNRFLPNEKEYQIAFPILPHKPTVLSIPIETMMPGMIEVSFTSFLMFDLLHLFAKEKRLEERLMIPVFPLPVEVAPVLPASGDDGLDEYAEYDARGAVSSDVKEIREYRPGDRLQRIHWKLSAKLDDIFVKEMEQTSTLSLILLPELTKGELSETIRTFFSLATYLVKTRERFQVCVYHHAACEFDFYIITEQESLLESYLRLCEMPAYEGKNCAFDDFVNASVKRGILVHICGNEIEFVETGL